MGSNKINTNELPDGWTKSELGTIGNFSKGKGVAKSEVCISGLPCIRYGEIYTVHDFVIKKFRSFISEESASLSKELVKNDILFAGSGETIEEIGKCVAYTTHEKAYAGGDIVIFSPENDNEVNSEYISYFLNTEGRRQINKLGQGQSVVHIYKSNLEKIEIALPTLSEQKRIVEILSTWDEAIEKTERLIDKKEKKYSYYLDLSYTKNNCNRIHLKELLEEVSIRNKDEKCQRVLSVTNDRGFVLPEEQFGRRVASSNVSNYKVVCKGQYAYNPSRINVGSIARLNDFDEGVLSPMYVVFKVDEDKLLNNYFMHWLSSYEAKERIKRSAQGSVRETVSFGGFASILIPLPDDSEQLRIVTFLDNIQNELDLYENLLEKYKEQKKGLMQQLLTGKKRVKV